jgi:hypothetical protein
MAFRPVHPKDVCLQMIELAACKRLAKIIDEFWSWSRYRFPKLFEFAIKYLTRPVNSVDAVRNVSQYTLINAILRQGFTDSNLTLPCCDGK